MLPAVLPFNTSWSLAEHRRLIRYRAVAYRRRYNHRFRQRIASDAILQANRTGRIGRLPLTVTLER